MSSIVTQKEFINRLLAMHGYSLNFSEAVYTSSRLKRVSKTSGKDFEMMYLFYFESGESAYSVESVILKVLREYYKNPPNKFDGYTEVFCDVDAQTIGETVHSIVFFNSKVQRLK